MADGEAERRIGQEGSRWYNQPPTGEELAEWFKTNVDLHEGLEASDYVQGVTMISGTEKAQAVVGWSGKNPVIERVENLVFTPYVKVETRVKYWHDLLAKHPDWLGVIEPVIPESQAPSLPAGFFPFSIQTAADKVTRYVCCTMKATIFKRDTVRMERVTIDKRTGEQRLIRTGETILDAPPATKMIATLGRYGPDDFALMKAETGAVGRALGLAGMLVIPGTGVATAEDLQEAQALESQPTPPQEPEEAAPPGEAPEESLEDLRNQALLVVNALKAEAPERFKDFAAWAKERGIGEIAKLDDPVKVRGLITKANSELADARQEAGTAELDAGGEEKG